MKLRFLSLLFALALVQAAGAAEVTLIHMGDVHGHLVPRPAVRSDGIGLAEGGLAQMRTRIEEIRRRSEFSLLVNTGDTVQGSAEALFTRGQALVDVLNPFGIDVFVPGNWDYVYGTRRFLELFQGRDAKAPWNTVAANLYYSAEPGPDFADKAGQRPLPPYIVKRIGVLRIGFLGMTTDRGPQVVGRSVIKELRLVKGDAEVKEFVAILREREKVDLVVMISELGLANNLRLAEANPGIDVVLSSDMHETAREPVIAGTGAILIEEGQDGTTLGELRLEVFDRKVTGWTFTSHRIDASIRPHRATQALVDGIRKTFVTGPDLAPHVNPFNGAPLQAGIDTVVGATDTALHRTNFSHDAQPAVIEGSSHNFLTDAFRQQCGAEIGAIRGFRYGTNVPPGPIRLEDLYHFVAIGPQIACGTISGKQLKDQIEGAANGSLDPDTANWTGGWLFNFSGVTMDLDPYQGAGLRASNIRIGGAPLDLEKRYTYASYWFASDPELINVLPAQDIRLLKHSDGSAKDGTEVVVDYLGTLPERRVDNSVSQSRIHLLRELPPYQFGFPEVQPLRGAFTQR